LESNKYTATKLKENRDLNGFNLGIISKALSKIELFQWKWKTLSKDILEKTIQEPDEKWFQIETISWTELKKLYPYKFNVLVLDCEGSFYYILKDEPDFLKGIEKILIENEWNKKILYPTSLYKRDFIVALQ